jgi:hypothetical protein
MKATRSTHPQASRSRKKDVEKKTEPVPSIKELLLSGPRFEIVLPKRTRWRRRPPIIFD